MEFLLQIEIIIWIVLTIMLIFVPLSWITLHYLPQIKQLFKTLQDIEFPDTSKLRETGKKIQEAVSLSPKHQETPAQETPSQEISAKTQNISDLQSSAPDTQTSETITPTPEIYDSVSIPTIPELKEEEDEDEEELETITIDPDINNVGGMIAHNKETSDTSETQSLETKEEINIDEQIKLNKKIETIKYTAMASKERGNSEQYEKKLVEGLALDPGNLDFLNMLSTHYFESTQQIKALTLLKKVVNKEPKNHKAIWQIGKIYAQQGQFETAQLLVEKAIALKNDHPKYYISLVEIWYDTGKIQKAIQTMEKLLKLRPTNTDYLLTMATLYEEDQKPTHAGKYFGKVLEIDPANIHGKKGVKRVK